MTEPIRTFLLIAALVVSTAGATAGVLGLKGRGEERAAINERPGQAPIDWNGWRLIPPSASESCEVDGYDACADEGEDGEPIDSSQDNEPIRI